MKTQKKKTQNTKPQNTQNDRHIRNAFFRIAERVSAVERPQKYVLDNESYINTEVTMVKLLHEQDGSYVTSIAKQMGITKGAVSQFAAKLEDKGIIKKEPDPSNQSRIIMCLTEKGERLYQVHSAFHRELDDLVKRTLDNATEENKQFLQQFLDAVEHEILKIHIE